MLLYSALNNGEPEDALEVEEDSLLSAPPHPRVCVCDDPMASLCVSCAQEKLGAEQVVLDLSDLQPATDYSVTLYALYDDDPSEPVTAVATTRKSSHDHLGPAAPCCNAGLEPL